jgi:hypothetical protein
MMHGRGKSDFAISQPSGLPGGSPRPAGSMPWAGIVNKSHLPKTRHDSVPAAARHPCRALVAL